MDLVSAWRKLIAVVTCIEPSTVDAAPSRTKFKRSPSRIRGALFLCGGAVKSDNVLTPAAHPRRVGLDTRIKIITRPCGCRDRESDHAKYCERTKKLTKAVVHCVSFCRETFQIGFCQGGSSEIRTQDATIEAPRRTTSINYVCPFESLHCIQRSIISRKTLTSS